MEIALANENETVIHNELELIVKSCFLIFEGHWLLDDGTLGSLRDLPDVAVTYDYLVNIHNSNHLIYPEDLAMFLSVLESANESVIVEFHVRLINASGDIHMLHGSGIFSDSNRTKPSIADWDNYTNTLELNLKTFEYAEAVSSAGSWRWNLDTRAIYTSSNFNRISGLHEGYILTDWEVFVKNIHPKDQNKVWKELMSAQEEFMPFTVSCRILQADNTLRYITLKGKPFKSRTETNYLLGTIQDVTESEISAQTIRKQQTELTQQNELLHWHNRQLQESKELMESVIQSDIVALSVFKAVRNEKGEVEDFEWIIANKLMRAIAQGQHVIGKRYTKIFPEAVRDGKFAILKKVLDTGERSVSEYYHHDKNLRGWFRSIHARVRDLVVVAAEDITHQKKAEMDVRESKSRLEAAFHVSTTALFILRCVRDERNLIHEFACEWMNDAALYIFDQKETSVLSQFCPPPIYNDIFTCFARAVAQNEAVDIETNYHEDHEKKWLRWKAIKLGDGLFVSAEDITQTKQAQRELSTLIENTTDVITRWSKGPRLLFANAALETRTGIPNIELYGKTVADMEWMEETAGSWMEKIQEAFNTGTAQTHYNASTTTQGTVYFFSRMVPEKNSMGEVETVLVIARDITELRKSEQELRKNLQILQQTEAVAATGSWEYIPSTDQFTCSPGMYSILGISAETEIQPEIYQQLVIPEDASIASDMVQHIRHGIPFEETVRIKVSGKTKTIKIKVSVIPGENQHTLKVLGVDFDITALTESERLKELNAKLKELDRDKTKFFSNVSHEFRASLTLLLGPLEDVLKNKSYLLPADVQKLEMAYRNSIRLQKLVNTLLDFSRIEAGKLEAFYQPTDLSAFTIDLASNFRSAIEKAGLRFSVKAKPIPEPVYVNREMWEKIVLNLLSNAFKFTHHGSIEIELRSRKKYAVLHVRDTGIGISAHNLKTIFDRFNRIEGINARTHEGTGIGLTLVKELVVLHGGTIKVSSTEGIGTEFKVFIPKGKSHLPSKHVYENPGRLPNSTVSSSYLHEITGWLPPDKQAAKTKRTAAAPGDTNPVVLHVDDNTDMREYLRHILSHDYTVVSAENGKKAIELVYNGLRPDIILADIVMPEIDGYTLVGMLKKQLTIANVPVIFLSARPGEEARIEGMQYGADDYLMKPFSSRELQAVVRMRIQVARLRHEAEQKLSMRNLELEHRLSEHSRKLEESRLTVEKQNAHLQKILDAIPQMVWVLDADGHIRFLNDRWYSYTGLTAEQCKNMNPRRSDIFHPDQKREIEEKWRSFTADPRHYRSKVLIRDKHRNYRWHLDIMEPIRNDSGEIEMLVGSFTDIQEQYLSEKQVNETNDLLEAVLNSSTNAISVFETRYTAGGDVSDFTWKYFNKKALLLAGQRDLRGKSIYSLLSQSEAATLFAYFERVMNTGMTAEFEHEAEDHGQKYWYLTIAVKLENSLVVTQHDITDKVKFRQNLLQLNESLKQKNYALKAMNEELANFAFIASHDLREPLRKIQLFTHELVEKEATIVTDRGKNFARKILDSVVRMNALIDDVLAFSKAGSANIEQTDVNLQEQLLLVLADLNQLIKEHHVAIEYGQLPTITGNSQQIYQLLQNLITNAIKFQPGGNHIPHARISGVYVTGHDIDFPLVDRQARYFRLEIEDNGIGFEDQYVDKIFHMFQRLHARNEYAGTGMGLAICKKVMQNHHGFITAKSSVGHGSVFSCYFPC
ncbi:MAG TPA: ATP-binding protein [Ohtaekwangia sp.]|uniref:ATP-binding protein n=1 Tax=Ohtaekwangia sp. TaxID=2066019 RepID=UPI002F955226